VALVYATRGDLGEEGVGGLLLQRGSVPAEAEIQTVKKRQDGLYLTLPSPRRACRGFVVKLDNAGGLTAGGVAVGQLK
jgi:hypothetical protein